MIYIYIIKFNFHEYNNWGENIKKFEFCVLIILKILIKFADFYFKNHVVIISLVFINFECD